MRLKITRARSANQPEPYDLARGAAVSGCVGSLVPFRVDLERKENCPSTFHRLD
jgi:hypothetical protein